jgi:hypothetical protein
MDEVLAGHMLSQSPAMNRILKKYRISQATFVILAALAVVLVLHVGNYHKLSITGNLVEAMKTAVNQRLPHIASEESKCDSIYHENVRDTLSS